MMNSIMRYIGCYSHVKDMSCDPSTLQRPIGAISLSRERILSVLPSAIAQIPSAVRIDAIAVLDSTSIPPLEYKSNNLEISSPRREVEIDCGRQWVPFDTFTTARGLFSRSANSIF